MRGVKVKGISSTFSKIVNTLRGKYKKPTVRKRAQSIAGAGPGGHRGIAAGSLVPGEQDLSPENIAKWQMLSGEEAEAFLYAKMPLDVHSSNVESVQFDIDASELTVVFIGGATYVYSNFSEQEAQRFLQAQSKGGTIWDMCRIRGSKNGHRKPFRRIV